MRMKHWFYTIPLRVRSLFLRDRVEQDLDDELQYHLEKKIEENIARGPLVRSRRPRRLVGRTERDFVDGRAGPGGPARTGGSAPLASTIISVLGKLSDMLMVPP